MQVQPNQVDGAAAPRIEVRNLTKSFRRDNGKRIVPVDGISLSVDRNELVVLLGPSGCGKTTLLRCVAGLERPDEGEIVIDGQLVFSSYKNVFVAANRRALSMVFQSFALWPQMTVAKNVAYPLESRHVPSGEIGPRVQSVLEMVGIAGLEEQYPGRISGGQQQRVALARALVAGSNVVLFDEPLSNVDAQVRAHLRFELKRMQQQISFSGLYVTHDQAEAMELGHRVAVLESGRIAALGAPRDIYENPPSPYVANFVGSANVWQGTVRSVESDGVTVDCEFGVLRVAICPKRRRDDCTVGRRVRIMVRPEKLRLSAERPTENVNVVPVTVEACMFSGAHTEIVVTSGSERARIWSQRSGDADVFLPDRQVWTTIPADQIRVVEVL